MRIAKMRVGFATVILMLMSGNCLAQPEIFRWVDDNGVVHFGEQPPTNVPSETVDIPATSSEGIDASPEATPDNVEGDDAAAETISPAEKSREERALTRREALENRVITEQACKHANEIIAQLEPFPRVMTTNDKGEMVRMDDNVRLEKLGQAQDYATANCSK